MLQKCNIWAFVPILAKSKLRRKGSNSLKCNLRAIFSSFLLTLTSTWTGSFAPLARLGKLFYSLTEQPSFIPFFQLEKAGCLPEQPSFLSVGFPYFY